MYRCLGFYVTCAAHVQRLLLERAMILDWLWLQNTTIFVYSLDLIRILIEKWIVASPHNEM